MTSNNTVTPPNLLRFFQSASLLISVALFSSCAGTGGMKVSSAPPPQKVSVAVCQFTSPGYAKLAAGDQGVRDFEQIYLAGKLVDRLGSSGQCSGAYFTAGKTAATDFTVDGSVLDSNGKDLSLKISVTRVDGKVVLNKKYDISYQDAQVPSVKATLTGFVDRIVGEILATGLKTNIDLREARFYAYAENPSLPKDPAREKDAATAGEIECAELLSPVTKAFVPRARVTEKPYAEWISLSAPLVDEKKKAKAQKASADFGQALGVLTAAASFGAGMEMAQAGNTQGVALAQQNMALAGQVMTEEAAKSEVAQNKISEISATLASLSSNLATPQARQVTIQIYGKVVKVSGSLAQQMAEFRRIVKSELNSGATSVTTNQP